MFKVVFDKFIVISEICQSLDISKMSFVKTNVLSVYKFNVLGARQKVKPHKK